MLILGIDTCCMSATAAIMSDDRLVAQVVQNNKKTHSQNIMPMIDFMLAQAELSTDDIDAFAVAVGPGSFTGVRIGVATIKALAHASGKPCISVSTLEALANNIVPFDGVICPILDARRGQVYTASFNGITLERITEDRALSADDLCKEFENTDKKIVFLGDGLPVYADKINKTLGDKALFAQRMNRMNLASSVTEIGYSKMLLGDVCGYAELKPAYLRLSQAERERLERMGGKTDEK